MAVGYYQLSWLPYVCWPAASYRLNAAFEDHAEHGYMLFVTGRPHPRSANRAKVIGSR